jgi:hypothetical protein
MLHSRCTFQYSRYIGFFGRIAESIPPASKADNSYDYIKDGALMNIAGITRSWCTGSCIKGGGPVGPDLFRKIGIDLHLAIGLD